jgi:TRAP-type C4-dicarboxylate transport system permease small subunit
MNLYCKIENILENVIKCILVILLAVMTIVTVIEVGRRYLMGLSYPWAEELTRFSLVWLTFVGACLPFRKGELVMFDMVISSFPERKRNILALVMNTILIIFLAFLFYYSYKFSFSPVIVNQISTGLGISMAIPYSSIPIGFGLMIFFGIGKYPVLLKNCRAEGGN